MIPVLPLPLIGDDHSFGQAIPMRAGRAWTGGFQEDDDFSGGSRRITVQL